MAMTTNHVDDAAPSALVAKEKTKARARRPWQPLTCDEARKALATSVHFYSKCTNTNAAPAGVRLAVNEPPLTIALVGFSTTALDRRFTTYTVGAPWIRPFGQVMSVLEGTEEDAYTDIGAGQKRIAIEAAEVLDEPFELRAIDPRLRQVLMPDEDGSFVALTPLHSDLFSKVVDERRREEGKAGFRWRRTVRIGLGGAKKQNMARRTSFMCSLLYFSAPREKQATRQALAIFYRGPNTEDLMPVGLLRDFAQQYLALDNPTDRQGMEWREYLQATIRMTAAHVLSACDAIAKVQAEALGSEPGAMTADNVDPLLRGMLDASLRDKAWNARFARWLIDAIESFKVSPEGARLAESGSFAHLIKLAQGETP